MEQQYHVKVVLADDVANSLKEPGAACFEPVVQCLGRDILNADGRIDRQKMAAVIFSEPEKLAQVNAIIHPAVRQAVLCDMHKERARGEYDVFFLEAALLIEEGYDRVMDELWYVYADADVRKKRLFAGRGYSEEKTDSIIKKQLPEEVFRSKCQFVLDNSGDFEQTKKQIDEKMEVLLCRKQK